MSHFSVLCILPEDCNNIDATISRLMEPYHENNMGTTAEKYLVFQDIEEEYFKQYQKDSVNMAFMPDGRKLYTWDEEFRVSGTVGSGGNDTHKVPDNIPVKPMKFDELFSSFEEYMEDFCGEKKRDKKIGKYGYWQNPNSRWDYWTLGGRFKGRLLVKGGKEVDACVLKELDLEAFRERALGQIDEFWGKISRAKELGVYKTSKTNTDKNGNRLEGDDAWISWDINDTLWELGIRSRKDDDSPIEEIPYTLEDLKTEYFWYWDFRFFSVVDKAGWHEVGKMGWFGISSVVGDNKKVWAKHFKEQFLDDLSPNAYLAVLDCHI